MNLELKKFDMGRIRFDASDEATGPVVVFI